MLRHVGEGRISQMTHICRPHNTQASFLGSVSTKAAETRVILGDDTVIPYRGIFADLDVDPNLRPTAQFSLR